MLGWRVRLWHRLLLALDILVEGASDGNFLSLNACFGRLRLGLQQMEHLAVLFCKKDMWMRMMMIMIKTYKKGMASV